VTVPALLAAAYDPALPAAPVLALMAMGVVIAVYGHAAHSYRIVAVGLALLFLSTALMLIGAYIAYKRGETDPRPAPDYMSLVRSVDGRAHRL
jgi:hypothetical protein